MSINCSSVAHFAVTSVLYGKYSTVGAFDPSMQISNHGREAHARFVKKYRYS